MQSQLAQMKQRVNASNLTGNESGNGGNNNGIGGNKKKRKKLDNPSFICRTISKYYWTHGGWAHTSNDFKEKAEWHEDDPTFEDKKGGSKAFCTWRGELIGNLKRLFDKKYVNLINEIMISVTQSYKSQV